MGGWVGGQAGGVEGMPQSIHHRGESFNVWHRFCPQDNCRGLLFFILTERKMFCVFR